RKAQEQDKKVVLAGCVPQAQPRMDYLKGLSIIGVQQIDRVVEVVDETVKGHSVRLLGQKKEKGKRLGGARLDLPKIRKNPLIEIISINTGAPLDKCFKFENGFTLKSTFSHSLQTLRQSQYMGSSVADITAPGKTQWILSDWCSYIDYVHTALDVPER
ncbi:putative threonylcarbamoyladenosine tRNA methylthiotransferase-like, partial [Triplophysa rosa]